MNIVNSMFSRRSGVFGNLDQVLLKTCYKRNLAILKMLNYIITKLIKFLLNRF